MSDLRARLVTALRRADQPTSDFDLNAGAMPKGQRSLRGAGVLVAVRESGSVILTKRAAHLSQHPGQVAFPGGKIDAGDGSARAAALREAWEEVGLPPESVDVLGELPGHETVTGYGMTPVLGMVKGDPPLRPEEGEVAEIFEVPLSFLANPTNYSVQSRDWRGQTRRYYAVPYGPYYIWGATARILRALAGRLA
ncbi:CoA pyrophosphatase [Palleronia sp. THAF1]|uniref:CoA pyrophosphatase n=1 Tax=Palleronia sp. THAF1 TaxID=2587842 RepID=UPI0020C77852|nr:CoA pyrophosphatase [Palleronia sp. THAF1]